jgi:hypothetical protein
MRVVRAHLQASAWPCQVPVPWRSSCNISNAATGSDPEAVACGAFEAARDWSLEILLDRRCLPKSSTNGRIPGCLMLLGIRSDDVASRDLEDSHTNY